MSGRSVNLTTLFLGRLRPPNRSTSTSCTYFHQLLTTTLLESVEGKTKVCGRTRYRTQDLWLLSQMLYRLHYAAQLWTVWVYRQADLCFGCLHMPSDSFIHGMVYLCQNSEYITNIHLYWSKYTVLLTCKLSVIMLCLQINKSAYSAIKNRQLFY